MSCDKTKYSKIVLFFSEVCSHSNAKDQDWLVTKATVSTDLHTEGQATLSPVSLIPSRQGGLYNAQYLFTRKDQTDGAKGRFNSVLNHIVLITDFPWVSTLPQ